ncbi:MAG: gliding motility-associated-like protein [Halioglobus sp.]|jgi:gliding motility-associated-like protein
MSQRNSVGIQEKEPITKINIDPSLFYNKVTQSRASTIQLPFEKLGYGEFYVEEDEMLAPDFAKARPDIKTYVIRSTKNKSVKGRMLLTPETSWATILTPQGLASFYPQDGEYFLEEGIHIHPQQEAGCTHFEEEGRISEWEKKLKEMDSRVTFSNGGTKRNLTLAIVCTGEFYELNGNSDNAVTTLIVATVNGLNVIYENELSAKFNILQPFLYKNSNTDPFIPDNNGGDGRTVQASRAVDMHFDINSYDLGHVFHKTVTDDGWSSGGVAFLGVVCDNGFQSGGPLKAGGWSGSFNNNNNGWISLSAHEFGHMFSATHTFNGEGESCDDAISGSSGYEIGSGTTIMSYQGICATAQNITGGGEADNYFHVHSLFQMVSYLDNFGDCATEVPLNNTAPEVIAQPCAGEIRIPKNTPFMLTGSATDAEDDELTFTWEQYDEDGTGALTQGFIGNQASNSSIAPLFRSFSPSQNLTRYFPQLSTLVDGAASDKFDVLPNIARTLHFQFTARDNNTEGGSVASDEVAVIVENNGPLILENITSIDAGTQFDVNWTLNGSEDLCDVADILLSIDGGLSYSIVLAKDVDYSAGSFSVTLSSAFPNTSNCRLMLACADAECYSFFDITDENCVIVSDCFAGNSMICDTEYEEFEQGDLALNFDLIHFDGSQVSEISRVIDDVNSTLAPILIYSETGGCFDFFDYYTNKAIIAVDETGSYTFTIDVDANGGRGIFTIYEVDTYSQTNPCASFIGASATHAGGSSFILQSSVNVILDECKEYLLILTNNKPDLELPKTTEISNIVGPGIVVEIDYSPSPDYSNIFIAVNDAGVIEVVSPTSDFSAVSGGMYSIYSAIYKSGGAVPPALVDPSTWVGNALSEVQTTDCLRLSANKKQILVEFSCRINSVEAGTQSECEPFSNTYSQEIIVTYESPPITGNLVVNGVPVAITGSPQIVNLTGLISDGQPLGVSAVFSALQSCSMFVAELFTAPANCCTIDFDLGGDQVVCDGEPIILDAGSDGVEYKWFKDGTLLENDTVSTYVVTESGNYLVEVINDVGCSKFEVVNIALFETPTLSLEDDKSVCEGEIFNLPAITTAQNLQWYKDDVELIGETSGTLLITEAGQYHIIGTNNYALPDEEVLGCSASDTIIIEYVSRPIVELGDDQEACVGDLEIILNAGLEGTEYTWARNGIVIPTEISDQLSVSQTGQYTVIVDKGGGCDAKDTVNITFYELSDIFAGQDVNVCEGSMTTLNPFIDAISFEWFFNGSLINDQSEMPEVNAGGEYILIGYNEIGCSISDTVLVTEVMPPMPDLGDDKVGCIGSEVELGVEGIGNVIWTLNNGPFSTEDTIRVTESGTYRVTILAANDCNGSDEIIVTFVDGPMLTLGNDDSFCSGDNYTISAMTDGDDITWFKDGIEIIGESGLDLVVTDSGMYTAIVAGASGCSVEQTVMVTENVVPIVEFTENETICEGETAMLNGPDDAETYQWIFDGAVISDQQSISVTVGGEYTLMVTNEFDCSASDMVEVVVNALPTLDLASSFAICEGEDAVIMADSDASSFQWFVNGEELTGQTGNTITLNSESMVEVIATNIAGCLSTASTIVTTAVSPTVALGDDVSLCPNEDFTLNPGIHDTYIWSNGTDGSTLTISSNVTELTTETYIVTVTNAAGCAAVDGVQVTLLPILIGNIEQSATGVCDGEPVQLTATGGTTYTWIDDSGTLLNIDGANATAFPSESTTYQVIIGDDCPMNEDNPSVVIDVFEAGEDIDAGEDDCAVNGKTVDLNAMGGVSYQWVDDPTIDSGDDTSNPTVSPTEETIYFVDVTDVNGCVFRDSVTICILDDPLEFFKLISIITPNGDGSNDELTFIGLESFPDNTITIYNRWGYPVFEQKGYQSGGELWDGENGGDVLPADTYYYVLNFNGETYKSHITIMR